MELHHHEVVGSAMNGRLSGGSALSQQSSAGFSPVDERDEAGDVLTAMTTLDDGTSSGPRETSSAPTPATSLAPQPPPRSQSMPNEGVTPVSKRSRPRGVAARKPGSLARELSNELQSTRSSLPSSTPPATPSSSSSDMGRLAGAAELEDALEDILDSKPEPEPETDAFEEGVPELEPAREPEADAFEEGVPASAPALTGSEQRRALFISYSRRYAGALNLTNVFVNCLRRHHRPDETPYSYACLKGVVVPWLDKEQMADCGGADWELTLTEVQSKAFLSVFFLSNAYCGSKECRKELQYASHKGLLMLPVFLESFAANQAEFEAMGMAVCCDPELQEFSKFETSKNLVERLMLSLQGVPAYMDLSEFICDECRDTRDTVCARCTDWASVVQRPCFAKLDEMAASLGRHVDGAAMRAGLLPVKIRSV